MMNSGLLRTVSVSVCLLCSFSCYSQADQPQMELEDGFAPILWGEQSSEYLAAGYLYFENAATGNRGICSATLIGSHWVLGSAHCMNEDKYPSGAEETTIHFGIGPSWEDSLEEVDVLNYTTHPKWLTNLPGHNEWSWDFALLEIQELESSVRPIPINSTQLLETDAGRKFYGYWYGVQNIHANQTATTFDDMSIKRKGEFISQEVEPEKNTLSIEWQFRESDVGCYGDSGGALLDISTAGEASIVAIQSSFNGRNCRTGTHNAPLVGSLEVACWINMTTNEEALFTYPPNCP